jgi:hypothetical protein
MYSSTQTDLAVKISTLHRDFPTSSAQEIHAVLSAQNYELARARIQLVLAKKQADQARAEKVQIDVTGDDKFESPFARASIAKDRANGHRIAPALKVAPKLPAKPSHTSEEPLVATDYYLSNPHSLSSTPEDPPSSAESVNTSSRPSSHSHSSASSSQRAPMPSKTQRRPVPGESVFALSRQPQRSSQALAPKPKGPLTIDEMLKRGEVKQQLKESSNRAKRKRVDDFYNTLDDLPEELPYSKRPGLGIIELEEENPVSPLSTSSSSPGRKKSKDRAKPQESSVLGHRLSLRSGSGTIMRKSKLMEHMSKWKDRFELQLSTESDSSSVEMGSDSAEEIAPTYSKSKKHIKDDISEEANDGSTTVGNESSSSERSSTGLSCSTVDSSPIPLNAKPPKSVVFYRRSAVRFGRIEEDDE